MNLGKESEILEFKKSTGELDRAVDNIASMLNKHGYGKVYFGVAPSGDVVGQQISQSSLDDVARHIKENIKPQIYPEIKEVRLDKKSLIEVTFSGNELPYSSHGRYYKRVYDRTEEMTPTELKQIMLSSDSKSTWENTLTDYTIEDIDEEALMRYYSNATSCGRLEPFTEFNKAKLLSGLGLLIDNKLTNAGFYLFSNKKPITLKMAVYVSDERINFADIKRIEENLYNLIEIGFTYIKEHINWKVSASESTSRVEIPEIPIVAIREIFINSLAHADYTEMTENEVSITPSQLEIYNPGKFPQNLTPEMFAKQQLKSMPRNKVILNTLYKSKDVEIFGSGLKKTYALCENSGNEVSYKISDNGFSFIINRKQNQVNVTKENSLNDNEQIVFNLLSENPKLTREELKTNTGFSIRTIQRTLDTLSTNGKIRRIGSKKTGYWETIE